MALIRYISIFTLLLQALDMSSIGSKKDSLLIIANKDIDDTNKVNALAELAAQYDYFNSRERIEYYIAAFDLSKRLNFKNGMIKISTRLITNLSHRQLHDVALEYFNHYLIYLKENNLEEELRKNYKLHAILLGRQGKYKESLSMNYKALNYYLSKNDAIQYATVLNNICLLHLNNKQPDSAYFYGLRAVDIFGKNNMISEQANTILGLAEISLAKKDYTTARVKAFESLGLYSKGNIELGLLNAFVVIGNIHQAENKLDSSIYYYTRSLELLKKYPLPEMKRDCYLALSKCYAALNKKDLAYSYHVLFSAYNDSVSDQRLKAKTLEMDAKYSITKKENELKKKEYIILNQNKQRNFLVLGLAGIIILLAISYRGYLQKKKANRLISEQKRLVEEKQKEIMDSIRYAKRIQSSLMPTEKYIEKNLKK